MQAFSIKINDVLIDAYIDRDNFDGFKQQGESGSLWDFWLDTISFTADISVLKALELTVNKLKDVLDLKCQLYYYGFKVFNGVVSGADYDGENEDINFTCDSYAKLVCNKIIGYGEIENPNWPGHYISLAQNYYNYLNAPRYFRSYKELKL
jgi:hypothetical protein